MLEEYRSTHIILKRDCLAEFVLMINKNENAFEEYDDMQIILKKKAEAKIETEREQLALLENQIKDKEEDEDGIDRGREVEEAIETSDEPR